MAGKAPDGVAGKPPAGGVGEGVVSGVGDCGVGVGEVGIIPPTALVTFSMGLALLLLSGRPIIFALK